MDLQDQGPKPQQGQNLISGTTSVIQHVSLIPETLYVQDDDHTWWIDSGATSHVCKDRHWFKDYEEVDDGSVLYMGDHNKAPIVVVVQCL